jgi:spore germination protein KC
MRWLKLFIAIAALVTTIGCWDRREVEELAIVTTMGLDLSSNGDIEMTVEIVMPQGKKEQQGGGFSQKGKDKVGQPYVISAKGVSVGDAVSRLQPALPRHLFWGQMEALVIGEALARKGLSEHLDFLARESEIRMRVIPFVCKGKARGTIGKLSPLSDNQADMLHEEVIYDYKKATTLSSFLENLGSELEEAMLPLVDILPDKGTAYLAGNAVFKGDHMVGILNAELSIGVRWLLNKFDHTIITVKVPDAKGYVSLSVLKSDLKLIPHVEQGRWSMDIRIDAEEEVDQNATRLDISKPRIMDQIERDAEELIRNQAKETLKKVQKEWGSDIFGFGEAFNRKYPQRHEEMKAHWDELFPTVKVTVSPKVTIRRIGLITSPSGLRKD